MLKRIVPLVLAVFCALALVSAASAARGMKLGIYDDAQTLGNTLPAFAQYGELQVQVVRVGLSWRAASPSKLVYLGTVRRRREGGESARDERYVLDPLDTCLGGRWRDRKRQPGADEHGVVAELRHRRCYPLLRDVPGSASPVPGRDAAAGTVLDRLERAERTTLFEASVQVAPWPVGGLERARVREDVLGGLPRRS